MANLIVRVLLGLEALGCQPDDVGPETFVKGGLELDIDGIFQDWPVVPAIAGHVVRRSLTQIGYGQRKKVLWWPRGKVVAWCWMQITRENVMAPEGKTVGRGNSWMLKHWPRDTFPFGMYSVVL